MLVIGNTGAKIPKWKWRKSVHTPPWDSPTLHKEGVDKLIAKGANAVEPPFRPCPLLKLCRRLSGDFIGNTSTYTHINTQWCVYRAPAKGSSVESLLSSVNKSQFKRLSF